MLILKQHYVKHDKLYIRQHNITFTSRNRIYITTCKNVNFPTQQRVFRSRHTSRNFGRIRWLGWGAKVARQFPKECSFFFLKKKFTASEKIQEMPIFYQIATLCIDHTETSISPRAFDYSVLQQEIWHHTGEVGVLLEVGGFENMPMFEIMKLL